MKFRRVEHPFERALAVSKEELAITLRGMDKVPWAEFFLNPRRLRGSDFLMRWSQGAWSEERLTEAVNAAGKYFALPEAGGEAGGHIYTLSQWMVSSHLCHEGWRGKMFNPRFL